MKAWKWILILVALAGAGFAVYWFYYRSKPPQAGSLAKQASPTYSPPSYTSKATMPQGAMQTKTINGQTFLTQLGSTATSTASAMANKLMQDASKQAAAAAGSALSGLAGNLLDNWRS